TEDVHAFDRVRVDRVHDLDHSEALLWIELGVPHVLDLGHMDRITIREARLARGLSGSDLALASDVSWSYESRLESGNQPLTRPVAERLAPVLGVPADALMAGQADLRQQRRKAILAGCQLSEAAA